MTECEQFLKRLSTYLFRHHEQRAVILIDEYDTPIQAGYDNDYYNEIIGFMRNFLSGGLKDTDHLFKGVLTGIGLRAEIMHYVPIGSIPTSTDLLERLTIPSAPTANQATDAMICS